MTADIWARGNAGETLDESEIIIFDGLLENMAPDLKAVFARPFWLI
jgi:hypothetical protein